MIKEDAVNVLNNLYEAWFTMEDVLNFIKQAEMESKNDVYIQELLSETESLKNSIKEEVDEWRDEIENY